MRILRYLLYYLASSTLLACSEPVPPNPDHGFQTVEVRTAKVEAGSWTRDIKSYGLVRPAEEYEISVEISANVEGVFFREGQNVVAGDLLIRLDDKKLKLGLEGARASVEEATANHEQARSTHERNKSIYKSGVISEQAYLLSEAKFKSATANVRRAIATYDIASEELADAEVISPINGVVTRRNVEAGQTVSPADHLGVIRIQGALRVESFVSQKDINYVKPGMPAQIVSPATPGQVFSGRVDRVASAAEISTGNFEVGVMVDDIDSLLKDGMSAMVTFRGEPEQGVLAVPRSAVVDRQRRLIVYRVINNVAQAVEPGLGVGNSELVPVLSGLDSGDEIVVSNLRLVSDGQEITRITTAPEG